VGLGPAVLESFGGGLTAEAVDCARA
jgi:hypothetical protein